MKHDWAIASDHTGVFVKSVLIQHFRDLVDLGVGTEEPADYPVVARLLTDWVLAGKDRSGILLCGTGIGMSICANRRPGIRAALVHSRQEAVLAKEHNHANILVLGARSQEGKDFVPWVQAWLDATPSKEERHLRRLRLCEEVRDGSSF